VQCTKRVIDVESRVMDHEVALSRQALEIARQQNLQHCLSNEICLLGSVRAIDLR
jgi:hypothetical protein